MPTRCRAASTASASRWSTRFREWLELDHLARRRGALDALPPRRRRGAAQAGRPGAGGQEGHEGHLPPLARDVQDHRVRLGQARASLPRARLPQFGRPPGPHRRAARGGEGGRALLRGRHRRLRPLSRPRQDRAHPRSDLGHRPARRCRHRGRARVERQLLRADPLLHQQHPAARRRHPPRRLPRRADPHAQQLCRQIGHDEAREGQPDRRRHARGADRDRLGQAARPQVRIADQGQAGLLRGPPAARKPDGRQARRMARGESRPCAHDHPEDHRRRRRPRGRPQGARGEPQVGARHRLAARQARRLPGARPRQVRIVPGRGRQRRRLGQAGPQPRGAGDPAA